MQLGFPFAKLPTTTPPQDMGNQVNMHSKLATSFAWFSEKHSMSTKYLGIYEQVQNNPIVVTCETLHLVKQSSNLAKANHYFCLAVCAVGQIKWPGLANCLVCTIS